MTEKTGSHCLKLFQLGGDIVEVPKISVINPDDGKLRLDRLKIHIREALLAKKRNGIESSFDSDVDDEEIWTSNPYGDIWRIEILLQGEILDEDGCEMFEYDLGCISEEGDLSFMVKSFPRREFVLRQDNTRPYLRLPPPEWNKLDDFDRLLPTNVSSTEQGEYAIRTERDLIRDVDRDVKSIAILTSNSAITNGKVLVKLDVDISFFSRPNVYMPASERVKVLVRALQESKTLSDLHIRSDTQKHLDNFIDLVGNQSVSRLTLENLQFPTHGGPGGG